MNFDTLSTFQTIADCGSLTKAAARLRISQPALSRTLRLLESELGFSVFDRTGNSLHLNRNGEKFLNTVRNILSEYHACIGELRESNGISSHMIIITFSSVGNAIPYLTYAFRKLHPESTYTLRSGRFSRSDTSTNFFIMSSYHPIADKFHTLLAEEPLYMTVSSRNPLSHARQLRLSAMKRETFLYSGEENDMYETQLYFCEQAGLSPVAENIVSKQNVLLMLIRLNMGISLLPRIETEMVKQIPVSDIPCFRYVYLIRNPNTFQPALCREFEKFTIQYFKNTYR